MVRSLRLHGGSKRPSLISCATLLRESRRSPLRLRGAGVRPYMIFGPKLGSADSDHAQQASGWTVRQRCQRTGRRSTVFNFSGTARRGSDRYTS